MSNINSSYKHLHLRCYKHDKLSAYAEAFWSLSSKLTEWIKLFQSHMKYNHKCNTFEWFAIFSMKPVNDRNYFNPSLFLCCLKTLWNELYGHSYLRKRPFFLSLKGTTGFSYCHGWCFDFDAHIILTWWSELSKLLKLSWYCLLGGHVKICCSLF